MAAVVAGLLAAAVLLADRVGLDRHLPFAALVAFRPVLTVLTATAGVLLLAVGARRRSARGRARAGAAAGRGAGPAAAGAALLVVAVAAGALLVPRLVGAEPAAPGGPSRGPELTLLTLNVLRGGADPAALAATIARERPDLVVLPEAGEGFRAAIAPLVPGYRSWSTLGPSEPEVRGVTVLAAPRAGAVVARRLGEDTRYPWAEVTGGLLGATRLAAVHLVAPVPGLVDAWPGELASLGRWCTAPGPTLVAGDFNASADHSAFRAGTAGCVDSSVAGDDGLVATWPSAWPPGVGARIDHVLAHGGPRPLGDTVLTLPGSDHRAVLARLRL